MKLTIPKFFSNNIKLSPGLFRLGSIMAMIIFSAFGYLDIYAMPSNYSLAWIIRYAIILPLLIITYFLSYSKYFFRHSKIILLTLLSFGQIGIIIMIGISNPSDLAYNTYYAGLILIMLWASFIFRINLYATIYIAISTLVLYNINAIFFQKTYLLSFDSINWIILLNNNFFLLFSMLLIIIAAYQFDKNILENRKVNSELIKEKEQLKLMKDISEENQRILSTLVQNLPGFMYRCKFDNNFTMEFISEPCFEITGYHPEDFINNKIIAFNEIIIPEYQDSIWEKWIEQLHKRENFQEVYQIVSKDGTQKWVWEQGCGVFSEKGDVIALEGYIFDITDFKNTQIELIIAKEKAEESDRLKSAFLANMSHEIRTPMNSILGFSNQLKKPNISDENKNQFISYIQNNGEILLKLINDIIDISKIESSQFSIKKENISLNKALKELVESYKATSLKDDKCEFNLQIPPESNNIMIFTDKVRLSQLLNNLIDNAVKYGNDSVEIGYTYNDINDILFYVKDNGEGISTDKYEYIFERFSQLNYIPNIGGVKGVGLGLSICKLITENLGGKIWVESEIGIGSTFFFKIPTT
ncbi:MAG: ATP-binding protein [Paludibacter sp.]|nr:ATP-binding protein [Paludibacter sp.]